MNFIETIFESFQKATMQFMGEIPNDIRNYCIGSGSKFEIHKNISYSKAKKIYEEYKSNLPLGRRQTIKEIAGFIIEDFATMESSTGTTYTFMFEIGKIIEHDPNEVIEEFMQTQIAKKQFRKDLAQALTKPRRKKDAN